MLGSFFSKSKVKPHSELHIPAVDEDVHSEVAHPHPPVGGQPETPPPVSSRPFLSAQNLAQIALLLLLATTVVSIWGWTAYGRVQNLRQRESRQHEVVLDSLQKVKNGLESQLDQLEQDFSDLRSENDTLAGRLASATGVIAEKERAIEEVKVQNTREENALRAQIQRLQTIKDRYEAIIQVLENKNAALEEENDQLRGAADSLSNQVSELGKKLENQIRQTMSAQYKATNLRVEMERRNDKLTLRAKRTRELKVSFELNAVPASYQGNQQLYLAITDDKGIPVSSKNPVQATIRTDKGGIAIIAQATQMQNVIDRQRITMAHKLEDRLKKGTYLASVYSDKGVLGVVSFRLQ